MDRLASRPALDRCLRPTRAPASGATKRFFINALPGEIAALVPDGAHNFRLALAALRASAPRIQRGQEGPCGSRATVADQRASGSGATRGSRNSTTIERLPDVSFRYQRDILSRVYLLLRCEMRGRQLADPRRSRACSSRWHVGHSSLKSASVVTRRPSSNGFR